VKRLGAKADWPCRPISTKEADIGPALFETVDQGKTGHGDPSGNSAGDSSAPMPGSMNSDWGRSGGNLDPEHHLDDDLLPRGDQKRMSTKLAARAARSCILSSAASIWAGGRERRLCGLKGAIDSMELRGMAQEVAAEGIRSTRVQSPV